MELRPLGMSGVLVSVIGLGTWPMGGEWWGGADDAESIRTIHCALDLGVSLIDTAEAYAHGHAEEVVGRALAGRRHDAVIADKVAPDHLRPHDLRAAFAGSCRRLGTDYIDVYFVHWPNIDLPLADAIGELERLREAGSIRAIGVSNFTADELAAAGRFGRVDVLQPAYNLFWRFSEQAEVPYCQEHAIGIMTYSSLAQGLLTGLLHAETAFPAGDQRPTTVLFQPDHYGRCLEAVEQLQPIAARYGKTVAQVALNWLVGRPGVSAALVGARTVAEIEENRGAVGWALAAEDLAEVDRIGRTVMDGLPAYPDMFGNWRRWELQQRRYERSGRLPDAQQGPGDGPCRATVTSVSGPPASTHASGGEGLSDAVLWLRTAMGVRSSHRA